MHLSVAGLALDHPPESEPERIARAYLNAARGDARAALVAVIGDALADLCEAERRTMQRDRLVSRGYVRANFGLVRP